MASPDSSAAQHLHDYRVNKTRGHEVRTIPRTCIECGVDARPRYLYCSDECSRISRQKTVAAAIAAKRGKRHV
jgi:hypothetical protein